MPDAAPPPCADSRAAALLREARAHEREGCLSEAAQRYEAAVSEAEQPLQPGVLAEALRRLSVIEHHRNEAAIARERCRRSHAVAVAADDAPLAAAALNTLGGFELEAGELAAARSLFEDALVLAGSDPALRARIEQNLGILANVQGEMTAALGHYRASLEAYDASGDRHGCAIAYHNLGMISADCGLWNDADGYFTRSLEIAESVGDLRLKGLCLLNHSEVLCARQQYGQARANAEAALGIFDQLGTRLDKADAYRIIGTVYRETGRVALAESRLRQAMRLAESTGSILSEAEASRELAVLYQGVGRNQEALALLTTAHRLFHRIDARVDLIEVSGRVGRLEETYFAVARDWGQSIESADGYTFGHCERVAELALAVARVFGLDAVQQTTVRVGAYLHDLGKVRVPHEILNKPGALTSDEYDVIKQHPVWGIELLAAVEFPWDIKPIIRWHHEKHDGTGYPDRLRGDEIPLHAQIIGIVDVYDALTTTRSYRPAMTPEAARAEIERCRRWWRPDVYEAFQQALAEPFVNDRIDD